MEHVRAQAKAKENATQNATNATTVQVANVTKPLNATSAGNEIKVNVNATESKNATSPGNATETKNATNLT